MSTINLYDTYQLNKLVLVSHDPTTFLLDLLFPNVMTFEDENVVFDKIEGSEGLAPFVSPDADGQPLSKEGYETKLFKPAYINIEEAVTPSQAMKRRAGEPLTGGMSPRQRLTAAVVEKQKKYDKAIYRRFEWMAAGALFGDGYIVEGDDYPAQHIKFGRKANNDKVLAGTELWTDANADITNQLETWSGELLDLTGYAGDTVIMGQESWNEMRKNKQFEKQFERYKGTNEVPNISPEVAKKVQYKGKWGDYHIFVYSGSFKEGDARSRYVPAKKVAMVSVEALQGTRCFGAIRRVDVLVPAEIFRSERITPNGKALLTGAETAPLIVPGNPDGAIIAKVIA